MAQKKSSKPWAQRSRKAKEAFAQSLLSLSSQLTGIFVTATAGGALVVLYKGASLHDIWIGIKQMMAGEIVLMLVVFAIFYAAKKLRSHAMDILDEIELDASKG